MPLDPVSLVFNVPPLFCCCELAPCDTCPICITLTGNVTMRTSAGDPCPHCDDFAPEPCPDCDGMPITQEMYLDPCSGVSQCSEQFECGYLAATICDPSFGPCPGDVFSAETCPVACLTLGSPCDTFVEGACGNIPGQFCPWRWQFTFGAVVCLACYSSGISVLGSVSMSAASLTTPFGTGGPGNPCERDLISCSTTNLPFAENNLFNFPYDVVPGHTCCVRIDEDMDELVTVDDQDKCFNCLADKMNTEEVNLPNFGPVSMAIGTGCSCGGFNPPCCRFTLNGGKLVFSGAIERGNANRLWKECNAGPSDSCWCDVFAGICGDFIPKVTREDCTI